MPWQQHVADVVLEVDPITGLLVFDEFGLTVPRQSGKSIWVLAKAVHRASATGFFGPRQNIVYTAQTRLKAREKWENDYVEILSASRQFKGRTEAHKSNGQEHITFLNRSRFGIEANTEKAGHGGTIDEAYIDEAFAHLDSRMEMAFGPAMITRRNKQLGWISTAGWINASPYLQQKVATGRTQAQMGVREGLAYFEWAAPEGADPADRSVWRESMPALGHTISEDAIAKELDKALREGKLNNFRRAYLNQWVPKDVAGDWLVVSAHAWLSLVDVGSQVLDPVAFACDATPDQSWGSIATAGRRADGAMHVEVVEHRPGTAWMAQRLLELNAEHRPCAVVVDPKRQANTLVPALEAAGVDVTKTTAPQMSQACGLFYEAAMDSRSLRHLDQPSLSGALAKATKRELSGAWAWDGRTGIDISPLVATTLALWGHVTKAHLMAPSADIF